MSKSLVCCFFDSCCRYIYTVSQKTSTFYFLNNCHDFLAREIVIKFDMNILQIVHLDLSDVATVSWEIEKSNVNNQKYV